MKKSFIFLFAFYIIVSSCSNTTRISVPSQDSISNKQDSISKKWNMFENRDKASQHPQHMDCTLLDVTIGENYKQAIFEWKNKYPISVDRHKVEILKTLIFEGVELEDCHFYFDDSEVTLIVLSSKMYKNKNEAFKHYDNLKHVFNDLMSTYYFVKCVEDSEIDPPDALFPILKDIYFKDECNHTISIDLRCQKKNLEAVKYDKSYYRDWWYITIQMYTYYDKTATIATKEYVTLK